MEHPMCPNCVHLFSKGNLEYFFCPEGVTHVHVSGDALLVGKPRIAFAEIFPSGEFHATGSYSNSDWPQSLIARIASECVRAGFMDKTRGDRLLHFGVYS
jgi:hypothetical protein